MLQINNISKKYLTGSLSQTALNQVSLTFRDNEFVAILGPSGSGKTTLLNIIGGLDRYDEGDIIINGISTKKYKDKDWDSYRNHTIGFVFQSYNLIPHQSVLSNVELALTISGVSSHERRNRAIRALDNVGLGDHIYKKPNQLSGGQMQRVAIARTLVNDPDILLADEPTGALDSDTSIQVMELLKDVAKDRLVVMVTHNPDLAKQYATRIVTLRDGVIQNDSDPCIVSDNKSIPLYKNLGRASMSFLTALNLSFNNLKTKLARTVLVSLAGSIGIIGISLILSLSNGVNSYIRSIEESTLSEYPVQITSSAFNFTSAYELTNSDVGDTEDTNNDTTPSNVVHEIPIINSMLSRTTSNDLVSLKEYLDNNKSIPLYTNSIEYSFGYEPHIYRLDGNKYRQVNPDSSFSALGFNSTASNNSILSMFGSSNQFFCLPESKKLYIDQYDILAGQWPSSKNEAVLVLLRSGNITDFQLYTLGIKDSDELDALIKSFAEEKSFNTDASSLVFNYKDFLGISFKAVSPFRYYKYDGEYNLWVDKSTDKSFMQNLLNDSEDLTIVGVVMPKADSGVAMLQSGIYYTSDLINYLVEEAANSDIVREQSSHPSINVFTGVRFDEENTSSVNLDNLFSIDESMLQEAFSFDPNALSFDASYLSKLQDISVSSLITEQDIASISMPTLDFESLSNSLSIEIDPNRAREAMLNIISDYMDYGSSDPSTDYSKLSESIEAYLNDPQTRSLLSEKISNIMNESDSPAIPDEIIIEAIISVLDSYTAYLDQNEEQLTPSQYISGLSEYLSSDEGRVVLSEVSNSIRDSISFPSISDESIQSIIDKLVNGYSDYAKANSLPDPSRLESSIQEYIQSERGSNTISTSVSSLIDTASLEHDFNQWLSSQTPTIQQSLQPLLTTVMQRLTFEISSVLQSSFGSLSGSFANAFQINTNAFSKAFRINMSENDFTSLMYSMMQQQQNTFEENLRKLGYIDLNVPSYISIYPKDFDSKEKVISLLNAYNDLMAETDDTKVISFTDTVGTLMSSVTTIVDTVSYVLVAFVAISLIVSSIMIGVITYISVLERKKEIGILRALGASKHNISQVFNAETFIIGALAGILGIILTQIILVPGNMLIHHLTNNYNVNAYLPFTAALILIALSIILTLIGGIIPSKKAAKSDPVTALRSE